MSTGAQVAVLDARGVGQSRSRAELRPTERPLLRLIALGALGTYGALRWGTMLSPAPVWRMLGMVGVALVIAGPGRELRAHSRTLGLALAVAGAVAIFPLSGIPFSWVRHVRITVTADAINQGLTGLPRALVPYNGINQWVRMVISLGAGVLLLDAALMVMFAPRPLTELRRAAAALPLVVLAIVPATMVRPQLAYVHGLILFALLGLFMWGERVGRFDAPLAAGAAVLAGAAGMIAAPALDQHSPWINYYAFAGSFTPGHVEAFDWSQRYGPLNWPQSGREVLDVKASRPDYWKTEDLDLFDGYGWRAGSTDYGVEPPGPDPGIAAKWTQTIQVTLRGMRTSDVVAAGSAQYPQHLAAGSTQGLAPGTWTVSSELQPGDSYQISTYSPQPSSSQLEAAGRSYPAIALQGYLTIEISQVGVPDGQIVFAPFGSKLAPQNLVNPEVIDGIRAIDASPYKPAYALAQRLAKHATTPYAFVMNVKRYLSHYTYNQSPPPANYPLLSFLFRDKIGYCQQFAGAMALLLRMGGIPARVATGFTTGTYDKARGVYIVSDIDAHAWVEVWFPHYGWVRFDPTPAAAPALGGRVLPPILPAAATATTSKVGPVRKPEKVTGTTPVHAVHHGGGDVSLLPIVIALVVLSAALALTLRASIRLSEPDADELLAELERALARCGRPVTGGLTLVALEHRFRDSPPAAQYVRRLRMLRFGGATEMPTPAQRRALRVQLRFGLGALGRLRALWALPPRWTPSRGTSPGVLH